MRKKRKLEINLEVEEAIAIRTGRVLIARCRHCRVQVRMVAANEAALITGLGAREVYRFVESGRLHFIEDHNGLLFICLLSLRELASDVVAPGEVPDERKGWR